MALKISKLEGAFGEVISKMISNNVPILIQGTDEYQIWEEPTFTYVPALNIDIHLSTVNGYDEGVDDFTPDCDQYNFYDHSTGDFLYSEIGSSMSVCIYNYCHLAYLDEWHDLDKIENMNCFYVLAPKAFHKNEK